MAIGKPKKITVDLYINKYVYTRVAQYDIDSREIIIQITDNGVPFPIDSSIYTTRIEYQKSDGNTIVNDIPDENILSDGTIKLVLSEQMCTSWGKNNARLFFSSATTSELIHTMPFSVIAEKSVADNMQITSSPEYTSFENALVRTEYILTNLKPITRSQIDELFH